MSRFIKNTCLAICSGLLLTQVQAATVEIDWNDPHSYRDIRGGNESQKAFEDRVMKTLGGYFEDAARESLPDSQSLHLTINDVDLAGDVEYFFLNFPQGVRVVRNVYFPSIDFSYELKNADGETLESGEENIKDMGYRFSGTTYINNPPFNYEKRLIDDWFNRNFGS